MISLDNLDRIEFNITSLCNAACPLCVRTIAGDKLELNSLPIETFKNLLDQLPSGTSVDFCGTTGDAMMHTNILELFEIVQEQGRRSDTHTNGGSRNVEFFKKLGKISAKSNHRISVTFAIDGLEDTSALYRIDTDYNKVIENAKSYINAGGCATWQYIIFEHNQHQVEQAKQMAISFGFKRFKSFPSTRFKLPEIKVEASAYQKKINKNKSQLRLKTANQVPQDQITHKRKTSEQLMQEQNNDISCRTLEKNEIFVDEKGRVWPCCFWHAESIANRDFKVFYKELTDKVGEDWNSLHHHSIKDIIGSYVYQEFLADSFAKKIPKCVTCIAMCSTGKEMRNSSIQANKKIK
jgi:MoaA/NifB/PqqE/SkfB family radical SAM enzyme